MSMMLFLLTALSLPAAERCYIGCRTGDSWAETPMLRKQFVMTEDDFKHHDFHILEYTVEVTSLCYHELYINGVRVGDRVLQPAVSQLDKTALTVNYDITELLHTGENEILLWLGQGWGRVYGTPAVVDASVMQGISDGECSVWDYLLWTDSSWEASTSGYSYTGSWQPLQFGGECYDARIQAEWKPATVYEASGISVSQQLFKGNRVVDTLQIVSLSREDPDGSVLVNFGRAVSGWFQVEFRPLEPGDTVTMEYLDHYSAVPPHTETDIYIAKGHGRELFSNRFHTHTFQYVRIHGAEITGACALQISAVDPKKGASFQCSDPRLNAIHDMVKYTLSNLTFSGYMVDCPHLERMGYGGDGNSSTMTLQTLWDVSDTYRNWMIAWGDAIDSLGDLPYVAPAFRTGGGPYWSGFIVKAPWRTYLNYGDPYLIVEYYKKMKRWLEFIERNSEDYLLQPWPDTERHSWFLGDWLAPEGVDISGESVLHVSNCFLSECLADMEQMALMRGNRDDARHYAGWRQNLNSAIHRRFYHPESHTYANGTPLDQAYALLQGIPPDSATAQAVKAQLLRDMHGKYRDHIAGGLVGVPVFTEWCIRERQADLMATLLRQPDYPGYLDMIEKGATTTWESWDCGREGKEDRSRVHNCYNGIGIWFYQALAGIRPDPEHPGYKHFYIAPQPVEGIEWIRATKPTRYGDIVVALNGDQITVTIPAGTTATFMPDSPQERLLQAGQWTLSLDNNVQK